MVRSTKTVLLAILFRALFNANIQAFRQAILNVLIVAYGRPSWALSGTALVVDIL